MSEISTREQQVTNGVEKVVSGQASRIEAAVGAVNKLKTDALERAGVFKEYVIRLANERLAFAEQLTAEWRKLVLAVTRSAAEVFGSKKA